MTAQKHQSRKKSSRDLKKLRILSENSSEGLVPRRKRCWGYVSIRIPTKRCRIGPLKVAATLLSGSLKDAVGA